MIDREQGSTIVYWPSSQICMDCKHGYFVMGGVLPASTYMCAVREDMGPCESSCYSFEEEEKKTEDDSTKE